MCIIYICLSIYEKEIPIGDFYILRIYLLHFF